MAETTYDKRDLLESPTQDMIKRANELLVKWPTLLTRGVKRTNGTMHRTMIKKSRSRKTPGIKDLISGEVVSLTAFPTSNANLDLSFDQLARKAASLLAKRTETDYDDFEDFKESVTSFAFVEKFKDDEEFYFKCSCIDGDGLKGKECYHVIAMKMSEGLIARPNRTMLSSVAKSAGRPAKNTKQVRF